MEVLGLFVLYVLGLAAGAGFLLVSSASRTKARLVASWGSYAARHRYAFAPGEAVEQPLRVRGTRDGVDFLIEASGRRGPIARLVMQARSPLSLVVATLGRGADGSRGARVSTGDAHFDRSFEVRASDALAVETVLSTPVRLALQRFPTPMVGASLRLTVEGERIAVEWGAGEADAGQVDAAHAIVRALRGAPA